MRAKTSNQWAQIEELGVYWMMKSMFLLYTLLGRVVFLAILYPVASYYFISNKSARSASMDYLKRIQLMGATQSVKTGYLQSYLHFIHFAECLIDKLSAWNNKIKIQDVVILGNECIEKQIALKKGGIFLGSHLGNVELCRALVTKYKKVKVNILVHTKHAKHFNRLLNEVSSINAIELIQVTELGPATAIALDKKVRRGEFVYIMGDRVPIKSHGRTSPITFLGEAAHFPQGPFLLASILKCPVFTLFCLKKQGVYHLYFEHFCNRIELPRNNRDLALIEYMQDFVERLQEYCLLTPLQWFNFYDFWDDPLAQERR